MPFWPLSVRWALGDRWVKGDGEGGARAWERVRSPNRGEESGNCFLERGPDADRPSGAAGLSEVELRDRLGGGRVEFVGGEGIHRSDGIGVELKCGLGRSSGGGESGPGRPRRGAGGGWSRVPG
jgi:hypothetical protein